MRERGGQQIAGGNAAQFFEIAIGEQRMRQLQRVAVLRSLVQNVALGADVAGERHHQLFADRIDGRIRHLREQLLEVMEQRLRLVGKTGQRRIGAHGSDRLFASGGHGREQNAQVLVGVAEGALAHHDGLEIGIINARRLGQAVERDLVLLQPLGVRLAARQPLLDLFVGNDAAFRGIHQQHFAGLQTALEFHFLRLDG